MREVEDVVCRRQIKTIVLLDLTASTVNILVYEEFTFRHRASSISNSTVDSHRFEVSHN